MISLSYRHADEEGLNGQSVTKTKSTYSCAANAVDIVFAVVREIIILKECQQKRMERRWGRPYDNVAYVLDI